MRSLVTKVTNEYLAQWFEENPTEANKVIRKAYSAAEAREAASPQALERWFARR